MVTTAASVDTRVRVLRLLNVIATVFPVNAPSNDLGIDPDLMACLCEEAFRINVVSSAAVRSAIDRRCRGANGEVDRVAELEYLRVLECRHCNDIKLRGGGILKLIVEVKDNFGWLIRRVVVALNRLRRLERSLLPHRNQLSSSSISIPLSSYNSLHQLHIQRSASFESFSAAILLDWQMRRTSSYHVGPHFPIARQ